MKRAAQTIFVSFVLLFSTGCAMVVHDNFYQSTGPAPNKIPLTVRVNVNDLGNMNVLLTQIGQAPAPESNVEKFRQAIYTAFSNVFQKVEMVSVDSGAVGQPDLLANVEVHSSLSGTGQMSVKFLVTLMDPNNSAILGNYAGESSGTISTAGEDMTYFLGSILTLDILLPVFLDNLHDEELTHIESYFSRALNTSVTKIRRNREPLMAAIQKSRDLQANMAGGRGGEALSSNQISEIVKATVQGMESGDKKKSASSLPAIVSDIDSPPFHDRPDEQNFGLIIGVEHYPGDIPASEFSDRDAESAYKYMRAMGIPSDHIKRLFDTTATRSRISGALHWLHRNVRPGATVWVYFSGHGSPGPKGTTYLVPFDGDPNDLQDTGYPLSDFYKNLNGLPAKRVIVALDSCFSGTGSRSVIGKGVRPLVVKILPASFPESGKLIAFAAAKSNQEAGVLKKQGHGMFTYYFFKGLDGTPENPGEVTVSQLYRYLKTKVSEKADLDNRSQVPQIEPVPLEKVASVRLR